MGIGQEQFYSMLGMIRPADAALNRAYTQAEEEMWRSFRYRSSFYASSIPHNPELACGRKALYSFMGFPEEKPVGNEGRAIMDSGLDGEHRFVRALQKAGKLISPPPEEKQIALVDRPGWIVGRLDIAVELSGRPHIIEVKGKDHDKITEMKSQLISFDPQHMAQLAFYVVKANQHSQWYWPELEPCTSGSLIYFSRNRTSYRNEYFLDLKQAQEIYDAGVGYVRYWRKLYEANELPPVPEGFMWSKGACRLCDHKKFSCKPDSKAGTTRLSESVGLPRAIEHYGTKTVEIDDKIVEIPLYDPAEARRRAFARWQTSSEEGNA